MVFFSILCCGNSGHSFSRFHKSTQMVYGTQDNREKSVSCFSSNVRIVLPGYSVSKLQKIPPVERENSDHTKYRIKKREYVFIITPFIVLRSPPRFPTFKKHRGYKRLYKCMWIYNIDCILSKICFPTDCYNLLCRSESEIVICFNTFSFTITRIITNTS